MRMRATLADALATPSTGVAATIMLDQSMPNDDGGKTRLANVIAALGGQIKALPPSATVGLWTFDGHEGRSEVAAGPLADQVNGQPRIGGAVGRAGQAVFVRRRRGVVHHAAPDLPGDAGQLPCRARRIRYW